MFAIAVLVLLYPIAVVGQSAQADPSVCVPRLINVTGVFRPS